MSPAPASGRGPDDADADRGWTAWLRPRARLVGTALGVGAVAGAVGLFAGALYSGSLLAATNTVFALGALALALGLLGWSGTVMAGPGLAAMAEYTEAGTDWSERDSRRAMARVGGFGAGVMVGVSVAASILAAVL